MRYAKSLVLSFSLIILVSGCCATRQTIDPSLQSALDHADSMITLSKAIDVVADTVPPDAIDDQVFNALGSSRKSELLAPFTGYDLKARIQDKHAVILLCNKKGEGLLEDATCTARLDSLRPPASPCKFMLDVKRVCSSP